MKALLQVLKWLATSAVFLLLFAFSLNNQTPVQLHFIFGLSSNIPLIMVILAAVGFGIVLGVLGMVPLWLRVRHHELHKTKPVDSTLNPLHGSVTQPVYHTPSNNPTTDYGP